MRWDLPHWCEISKCGVPLGWCEICPLMWESARARIYSMDHRGSIKRSTEYIRIDQNRFNIFEKLWFRFAPWTKQKKMKSFCLESRLCLKTCPSLKPAGAAKSTVSHTFPLNGTRHWTRCWCYLQHFGDHEESTCYGRKGQKDRRWKGVDSPNIHQIDLQQLVSPVWRMAEKV